MVNEDIAHSMSSVTPLNGRNLGASPRETPSKVDTNKELPLQLFYVRKVLLTPWYRPFVTFHQSLRDKSTTLKVPEREL